MTVKYVVHLYLASVAVCRLGSNHGFVDIGRELCSRDVARPVFRLGLFTISHYIISRP